MRVASSLPPKILFAVAGLWAVACADSAAPTRATEKESTRQDDESATNDSTLALQKKEREKRNRLSAGNGRGVLIIAVDALRADHVSLADNAGYEYRTTPKLAQLGLQSIYFEEAWSASPELLPAHIGLMTGCDPMIARRPPAPENMRALDEWQVPLEVPRLAEQFLANGWTTAAFIDHSSLDGNRRGLRQGFQVYKDPGAKARTGDNVFGFDGVGPHFKDWLLDVPTDKDWFAYLHLNDLDRVWPHLRETLGEFRTEETPEETPAETPAETPGEAGDEESITELEPFKRPRADHERLRRVPPISIERRSFFAVPRHRWDGRPRTMWEYLDYYDLGLQRMDHNIHRLLDLVEVRGRLQQTTIVVVGTYGIGFGESGLYLDSGTLSDVDLHIPLWIKPAQSMEMEIRRIINVPVSTIDIAPTLLAMHGIPPPAGMHGRSLLGLLVNGEEDAPEPKRKYLFASAGLYAGFAAIDSEWTYERAQLGLQSPVLAGTWYGHGRPLSRKERNMLQATERIVLKRRGPGIAPGHLDFGLDPDEAGRAGDMHDAGIAWYELIMRARHVLHDVFHLEPPTPEEIAYLQSRGVIGELER